MLSLFIYMCIVILGYFMTEAIHFYLLAGLVGVVQGISQSTARSLFSNLMPSGRTGSILALLTSPANFHPFWSVCFGWVGQITGSSRWGILSCSFSSLQAWLF